MSALKFINVGYGNLVAVGRIVSIASPDSAPIKRLVQDAKEVGQVIDVSCGKKTRSVIITDSRLIILSALETDTLEEELARSE